MTMRFDLPERSLNAVSNGVTGEKELTSILGDASL